MAARRFAPRRHDRAPHRFPPGRQRGAVGLIFALMALILFGFMGMALDLGRAYDRRTELQNIVDAAALAGAKSLNGTTAGVTTAVSQATSRVSAMKYNFGAPVSLNANAMTFGSTPDTADGAWKSVAAAASAPIGLYFMRIDAGALTAADGTPYGQVDTIFVRLLAPGINQIATSARAVAGHFGAASTIVLLYQ